MRAEEMQKILMENSGGFIAVNKNLIASLGLHEAILYTELVSKLKYYQENDMTDDEFYCTYDDLCISTGILKTAQQTALKNLENFGLIKINLKGMPRKRYIRILDAKEKIIEYLEEGQKKIDELIEQSKEKSNILKEKIRGKSNIEHLYVLQDQNYKKEYKVIISPIMARYLVKKGFVIKDIKPNKHYPRETCFVFENSQELLDAMTYFQENIKK